MKDRHTLTIIFAATLFAACEPAEDVPLQELPSLARSSVEARLGLPELRGAWRFAGWELEQGDTLGLDAELPGFGILWLQAQKRDSLAGLYVTGSGRVPLYGEVRRDRIVALVAFPAPGDGRYLVGEVTGDTLWMESTSLSEPASWRGDARVAFVRSQTPLTPFRRVRGYVLPPAPDTTTLIAGMDSAGGIPGSMPGALPPTGVVPQPGVGSPVGQQPGSGATPATTPPRAETGPPVAQPVTPPVTEPEEEPAEAEPVEEPEPTPTPVRREPPRVLGVPVDRD